ncbi:unnamed protein product, partial [Iphiclides podalirius]
MITNSIPTLCLVAFIKIQITDFDLSTTITHVVKTSQEQGSGYSTTEPVAILGKPLVVSMIEFNPAGMDINTRSEIPAQKQCVQDCQSSSSYSPVCGTNNVTYFNKEKFLCAQKCGINVSISKLGACS